MLSQNLELTGLNRFEEAHNLLKRYVKNEKIAGANALVLEKGEIVYQDNVGWKDVENNEAMSPDTILRIASMTKAITSVAIMMLWERGELEVTDPLSKFIPEFVEPLVFTGWDQTGDSLNVNVEPANREITIHDLLTHTSGLTYSFMEEDGFAKLYKQEGVSDGLTQTEGTLEENIKRLAKLPLKFQPGSDWQYSLSYDVLGRVIEVISGDSLKDFLKEQIFDPLEMVDTYFFLPESKRDRLAQLYTVDSNKNIVATGEKPIEEGNMIFSSSYNYKGPRSYYSGGSGLVSTILDYARLLQMLLNKGKLNEVKILEKKSVQLMTQNQIGSLNVKPFNVHGDKFGYGFGVLTQEGKSVDVAFVGTFSWGGTFNTYYWVDPVNQLVGIVMPQLFPYDHLTFRNDFKKAVYNSRDLLI